jgi:hypothetical protein
MADTPDKQNSGFNKTIGYDQETGTAFDSTLGAGDLPQPQNPSPFRLASSSRQALSAVACTPCPAH